MQKITGRIFGISLFIFVILILSGVGCIYYSIHLNEYIEGNAYTLDFGLGTTDFNYDGINKIHINNFCFYYDFTKNKGKISFCLDQKDWSLSEVYIEFPSLVENDTFEIYSVKSGTKIDFQVDKKVIEKSHSATEVNYTRLELTNFSRIFNDEKFVIEFDSNLQPSGTFSFVNNDNDHFSPNYEEGNVNFVLGDEYECTGNCVYGLKYIEELSNSSDRNLKFKFNEKNDNSDRWLKIDAVNRKTRWLKSFFMGVGISLVFASLSSIFVLIYDDGANREFENLRKVKEWIFMQIMRIKNFIHQITNTVHIKIQKVLSFLKSTIKRLKK